MSDWQVGDLAVCVDSARRPGMARTGGSVSQLFVGKVYTVEAVNGANLLMRDCQHPLGLGWNSNRFRKIRPDEHEACEDEFVILLKLSKQRVSA